MEYLDGIFAAEPLQSCFDGAFGSFIELRQEFDMNLIVKTAVVPLLCVLVSATTATAQSGFGRPANISVQLPVVSVFNVRTTVMVPDGGTMSLGGVSRHSSGSRSIGVPGLGGPLFRNRGRGYSSGGSQANVKATILSNREIGEDLLAEGNRRAMNRERFDPNGTYAVQAKADFISKNVGRSRRK